MRKCLRRLGMLSVVACSDGSSSESMVLPVLTVEEFASSAHLTSTIDRLNLRAPVVRHLGECCFIIHDRYAEDVYHYRHGDSLARRIIRRGSGPGELAGPITVRANGSVAAVASLAPGSKRVLIVDTAGVVIQSVDLTRSTNRAATFASVLANGDLLVDEGRGFHVIDPRTPLFTEIADSGRSGILSFGEGSPSLLWFGRRLRSVSITHEWRGGPPVPAISANRLTPMDHFVVAGERLWSFSSGTGEIVAFNSHGDTLVRRSIDLPFTVATPAEIQKWSDLRLLSARTAVESSGIAAVAEKVRGQRNFPMADTVLGSSDGRLWLRLFTSHRQEGQYVVIDTSGILQARVVLPRDVHLEQVSGKLLIGRVEGVDGSEAIRLFSYRYQP